MRYGPLLRRGSPYLAYAEGLFLPPAKTEAIYSPVSFFSFRFTPDWAMLPPFV